MATSDFTTSTTNDANNKEQSASGLIKSAMPETAASSTAAAATPTATSSNATASTYAPTSASVSTADAVTRQVQPNETVASQLKGLISEGSPLLDQARTRALEQMNSRGLVNSSMALTAADSAMYDAALPIAQQDASTYTQASRDNQAVLNSTNQFNATAQNQGSQFNATAANQAASDNAARETSVSQQNAQLATQTSQFNAGQGLDLVKANLSAETQRSLAQLDATTRTNLANLEAQNKVQLQSNASAAQMYTQVLSNIASIQQNPNMDGKAKADAMNAQFTYLQASLKVADSISKLGISDLLDGISASYGGNGPAVPSPAPATPTGNTQFSSDASALPF